MGEHERQRVRATPQNVHQMQRLTVELGSQLAQAVETALERFGVERTPILQQPAQPVAGHASFPAGAKVRG